jgi:hypothetical protein
MVPVPLKLSTTVVALYPSVLTKKVPEYFAGPAVCLVHNQK